MIKNIELILFPIYCKEYWFANNIKNIELILFPIYYSKYWSANNIKNIELIIFPIYYNEYWSTNNIKNIELFLFPIYYDTPPGCLHLATQREGENITLFFFFSFFSNFSPFFFPLPIFQFTQSFLQRAPQRSEQSKAMHFQILLFLSLMINDNWRCFWVWENLPTRCQL